MVGAFYIEQPQTCGTWKLKDRSTRQLLDRLSAYCIRDPCFDKLTIRSLGYRCRKALGYSPTMPPSYIKLANDAWDMIVPTLAPEGATCVQHVLLPQSILSNSHSNLEVTR